MITYTIIGKNPMRVKESVRGDGKHDIYMCVCIFVRSIQLMQLIGKLCGATFVDERFQDLLRQKIPLNTWERLGDDGIARLMNIEWENGIKPQFSNDGRKWSIQIPVGSRKRDLEQYMSSDINIHK